MTFEKAVWMTERPPANVVEFRKEPKPDTDRRTHRCCEWQMQTWGGRWVCVLCEGER